MIKNYLLKKTMKNLIIQMYNPFKMLYKKKSIEIEKNQI